MAITITIDNDQSTVAVDKLVLDESSGLQTPISADTGNDSNLDFADPTGAPDGNLYDGTLSGASFSASFLSFLNAATILGYGALKLSDVQKAYAAGVEGSVSAADFVKVTTSAGEVISDLYFSDSAGQALDGDQVVGMQTLDGSNVYLWSSGDYCIATTSSTAGAGRVVAAFYLKDDAADHLTAQIQMVTFEPLKHPDGTNPDDALDFTNVLQVSAAGTLSFNFDNLPSGSFLYAAVGSPNAGILVTGQDLNVIDTVSKQGDMVKGGSDPSDSVNTSQGGIGATIGINSQHFTDASGSGGTRVDGAVGVFTLVKGFTSFDATVNGTSEGTGVNVNEIGYTQYIDAPSTKIFISQVTGSSSIGGAVRISLWEAGGGDGGAADHAAGTLTPEQGYGTGRNAYIGNDDTDQNLKDDWAVAVGSVTVKRGNTTYTWTSGNSGANQGGIIVTFGTGATANTFTVTGLITSDTIGFTALDTASPLDGTFNRFDVQALANSNPVDIGRIDLDQGVSISQGVGGDLVVQDDHPSVSSTLSGAPSLTVDETTLLTDDTKAFAGQFTPSYGTDGPGGTPVTYALSTPGGNSGLVDTATGHSVFLFLESGKVVGRQGTDSTGAATGDIVFTVSVDASGNVTLDQKRAVVHSDTSNPDDNKTLSSAGLVVLTAIAHDGDGDTASAPLNIGQLLNFHDDGPSITASSVNAPTITDDESALGTNNSASYAAQFSPTYGADGQGATPVTYALSTPGGDSGLVDTATGHSVFLFLESGQVVGREGTDATAAASGQIVFVVSVNSSGNVTLDQQRAIVHPDATNPDDSKTLSAANLVVLTATAHDGDGDTATAPLNIGQLLIFKDDGPSITASSVNAPTITDDETVLTTDHSASYAAQFSPSYGADGQAATPVTYALSTPGGDSGLIDTASNHHVFLFLESGQVVGREGTDATDALTGDIVFVVSVDGTGQVTLDQQRAIVHPNTADPDDSKTLLAANLVVLTATAYDKDGDSATAPLNIGQLLIFKDDGPSISATSNGAPTITDDESAFGTDNSASYAAQFSPTYGADGQGATPVTYAISATSGADSGLIESGSGNSVFLFNESGTVVGRAGANSGAAATGDIVFVASIDGTGTVTLDQRLAVVHNPNLGPNDTTSLATAGLVVVTATAHDGDGDVASTGLNIGTSLIFQDDTPTITSQIANGEVHFATDGTGTTSHSLNGSVGADINNSSQQSLTGVEQYTITYWTTPTNVYPNLTGVLSADGTTLIYYSTNVTADQNSSTAVYQLALNQTANSGAGSYTFTVLQPPPNTETHFGFQDLPSGQNLDAIIAVDKTNIVGGVLPDGGLLVFPTNPVLNPDGTFSNTSGTINTSKGGGPVTIGNGNQAFDNQGEGAWFMYVDNPNQSAVGTLGLTQVTADDADTINFNGTNQATDASVSIVQASGAGTVKRPGPSMHITAYEATPGNVDTNTEARNLVNDPTSIASNGGVTAAAEVNIVGIKIHDSTGKVIEYRTVDQTAGTDNFGTLHDVTGDGLITAADDPLVGILFALDNPKGAGTADDIYSVTVSQLKAGYTIEFITATDHNLAKVEWAGGSFDIGGFNISNQANIPEQDFSFAVQISDYDNDVYGGHSVAVANFNVTIDALNFI